MTAMTAAAPSIPKHEIVLKDLRHERNAEDQRLQKLRLKITEQLKKPQNIRAV